MIRQHGGHYGAEKTESDEASNVRTYTRAGTYCWAINGTADSQICGLCVELVKRLIHVLQSTMQSVGGSLLYRHRVEQNVVPQQRSADTGVGIEEYAQQRDDESRGPSAQSVGQLRPPLGARSVAGLDVKVTYPI